MLATTLKICLMGGSIAAVIAAPFGSRIVETMFGERFLVAGQAFSVMMWGIGPYAAAFIAISALIALAGRSRAIGVALLMVMIQGGGIAFLAGPLDLEITRAAIVAFLVASLAGMAWALHELTPVLYPGTSSSRWIWWLTPTAITLLCAAISLGGRAHPLWASLTALAVIFIGTTLFAVFPRREVAALIAKTGLWQRAITRWLGDAA